MRLTFGLLLTTSVLLLGGTAEARKLQNYVVQRGDTCWNIAERFIGDGKKYTLIHKHNKLGPAPHLLKEGTLLKLPARPAPGKVSWLQRKVNAKGPRAPHWQRARRHMSLWRLYKIATDKGSSAGIEFTNHSRLQMRESALLVIYGGAKKSLKLAPKRLVRLERGVVRGGLAALDKRARLMLKTPAAKISLASRDTQIEVDPKKRSSISVFEGSAAVTARGKTVQVPTGHGVTVAKGQRPKKPRPLLPRPRWKGRRKQLKVILPGERGHFSASWQAVSGAKRYRFVVANNRKLQAPIADATVGAGVTRFRVERLRPGTYWARVQAIDARRLASPSSAPLVLKVLPLRSSRRLLRDKRGRIQVVGAAWVAVDGFNVSAGSGPFQRKPVLVKGRGAVRVGVQGEGYTPRFLTLQVIGVKASFKVKDRVIDGGSSTTIDISAQLDSGAATFVPGLTVNCGDGPLPLRVLSLGRYQAALKAPPQAAASMLACKVYWLGGKLGAAQVIIRYNEQAAKAYAKKRRELQRLGKLTPATPRRRRAVAAAPPESIAQASQGDPDPDVDGVTAPADKCPHEPEDKDGFKDDDGCPDPDNDHDGIPDVVDKCPLKPETVNGIKDDDGCPDEGTGKASIKGGKVSITERVYFASGHDTISPRSTGLLRQIARVLKANWRVRKVRIEGHTDDRGDDELNVDLSQRRAESVKRALVRYGVAAHRLVAVGFGPTKPVKSNKTRAGRAANRRVLFIVTKIVKLHGAKASGAQ